MKFLVLSILTLIFSNQSLATTKEDIKQKATETVSTVADYSKEQKEEFQKDMEAKLSDLGAEISQLKSTVSETSGEAKKDLNEKIAALEAKQSEVKKDLAKLKKSSGKAWSEMKTGVSKAWDALSDSYKKAKAEFKEAK